MLILDRGIVASGYIGHVDTTIDGQGNIFAAFVQERIKGKPGLFIRRRQGGTGVWSDVVYFPPDDDGKYGGGKFGHSALECKGKHLVVVASRRYDTTGETVGREYIILDVCEE